MNTIMTFPALQTVTNTAADAVVDAIKIALAQSASEKAKTENLQDSVLRSKITRAEVLWYFKKAFPRNRANRVDEDKLVAYVFEALPEERIVHFKTGTYVMQGTPIKEKNKVVGIMMTTHDHKVKPIEQPEPQIH